jgi:predicted HicB family RNase H-like nuclease
MRYKGYEAIVTYDEDAKILHGEVIGLKDVVTFQADCGDDVEKEFKRSVDEYLKFCAEIERQPEKPYSGKFLLRMEPALQARIAVRAKTLQVSENKLINQELEKVFN